MLDFAGRIGRWALPLASLDLKFKGRASMKGQVVENFLLANKLTI